MESNDDPPTNPTERGEGPDQLELSQLSQVFTSPTPGLPSARIPQHQQWPPQAPLLIPQPSIVQHPQPPHQQQQQSQQYTAAHYVAQVPQAQSAVRFAQQTPNPLPQAAPQPTAQQPQQRQQQQTQQAYEVLQAAVQPSWAQSVQYPPQQPQQGQPQGELGVEMISELMDQMKALRGEVAALRESARLAQDPAKPVSFTGPFKAVLVAAYESLARKIQQLGGDEDLREDLHKFAQVALVAMIAAKHSSVEDAVQLQPPSTVEDAIRILNESQKSLGLAMANQLKYKGSKSGGDGTKKRPSAENPCVVCGSPTHWKGSSECKGGTSEGDSKADSGKRRA